MQQHLQFIENLVNKGGPEPNEYEVFGNWLDLVAEEVRSGKLQQDDLQNLRLAFGDALSQKTLIGFACRKPYNYAGDFEIIDKMYIEQISSNSRLENWDKHYHTQNAAIAVRNRKKYVISLLKNLSRIKDNSQVLDVASGPARDLLEFFSEVESENVFVDCVEYDPKAIEYASRLCQNYLHNISFHQSNPFRFKTEKKYDLVWSAGLFDYFNDDRFKFMLKRLLKFLAPDGELVIGNFSDKNPTRSYMEILGDWNLNHRSREQLTSLALECGAIEENISINSEQEGINLFLHIKA